MLGTISPPGVNTEILTNNTFKSPDVQRLPGRLFGDQIDWETNGRETIIDMVKRRLDQKTDKRRNTKVEFMLFKRVSDAYHLNIGLPTGALPIDHRYECYFKENLKTKTTDMIRNYFEEELDEVSKLKSFYVKLENISVSSQQKMKGVRKLMVHFFPEETLYEALCKDGRFDCCTKGDELVIRQCDFLTYLDDEEVPLNFHAVHYAGQTFKFKRRSCPNEDLPLGVHTLHKPVQLVDTSEKATPDYGTPTGSSCNISHVVQSTVQSTQTPKVVKKLHSDANLIKYIEESFKLKLPHETNRKKKTKQKRKNEKFFEENYVDFALDYQNQVFASDVKYTLELVHSIGAIIAVNVSGVKKCAGTCFRVGKQYIITNDHVVNGIEGLGNQLRDCYVDFNYKEDEGSYCFNFDPANSLMVRCAKLDYAILKLCSDDITSLPCSVTDKFNIAPASRQLEGGECLTLIGHPGPGELKKQMDISCPIKRKEDLEQHLVLVVKQLKEQEFEAHKHSICHAYNNPNTATYDVSTFFWGSSGSPGLLMQERLLMCIHSRGIPFQGTRKCFVVEEGILMSSIVKDVISKIDMGELQGTSLADIFGETTANTFNSTANTFNPTANTFNPTPMDTD